MAKEIIPPDFEDMSKLAYTIGQLLERKLDLEDQIARLEANSIRKATNVEIGQKPPSMEYLKLTIKYTGLEGEILPLRAELVTVTAKLEEAKLLFETYRGMISLYQTQSSNKRASLL